MKSLYGSFEMRRATEQLSFEDEQVSCALVLGDVRSLFVLQTRRYADAVDTAAFEDLGASLATISNNRNARSFKPVLDERWRACVYLKISTIRSNPDSNIQ